MATKHLETFHRRKTRVSFLLERKIADVCLPDNPGRLAYHSEQTAWIRLFEIRMESTVELRENLKRLIVERLNLIDVSPDDIGDEMPLFKTGLGLDSIDALELTLNVEKEYGVKVANSEQALQAFQSVATLAGFIEARRGTPA